MSLRFLALLAVLLLGAVGFAAPPERSSGSPAMHATSDLDDDESEGSLEPAPDEEGPSAPDIFTPWATEPAESPDTPESI